MSLIVTSIGMESMPSPRFLFRKGINMTIRGSLLGLIVLTTLYLLDRFNTPYVFKTVAVLNPAIYPGDILHVEFRFDRKRICRTQANRKIINFITGEVVRNDTYPSGNSDIGDNRKLVGTFSLPIDIKSGKYFIRYRIVSDCGWNTFTFSPPEAVFLVLDSTLKPVLPLKDLGEK